MKQRYSVLYLILVAMLALTACTEKVSNAEKVDKLPPIFPDYIGVTIPQGIAPLNFNLLHDGEEAELIDVIVRGSKGGELHTQGRYADFNIKKWHSLTATNKGGQLTFTVAEKRNGKWHEYKPFDVSISTDTLEAWGLTYRRIAPGYEVYSEMGLYERNLSDFTENTLINNTYATAQCMNCHTPNKTNPDQYVFHIRGTHGGTYIHTDGKDEILKAKNDDIGGSLVYPYWHPEGKFCAFSTNQTRQGFHALPNQRIEVFDLSSDVLVYNTETHSIISSPLLSTKEWSENTPVFSPDGKWLYFITCIQQDYPVNFEKEQYNLCRIAFDAQRGEFGGEVDTLFNAVAMGKSVTWPRPSYDGKFLLFTLQDYGYFSIWHSESDQWLLNLTTGEAKPVDAINSQEADSYHNWSANSRWIVFTSRRINSLYTHLYLAHIDEQGNASKPFLLPQKNPWNYYDASPFSFNTPDFTQRSVGINTRKAVSRIMSGERKETKVVGFEKN